jgi:hypothetical protein
MNGRLFCARSTQATLKNYLEEFSYIDVWLAVHFSSSTILLAVRVVGAVIGGRTLVPNMLGYVVSMTYNNMNFPLPERGGVLAATHQARILRDQHISVSDVEGGSDVGRLAFTSITDVRPLEMGRKYFLEVPHAQQRSRRWTGAILSTQQG